MQWLTSGEPAVSKCGYGEFRRTHHISTCQEKCSVGSMYCEAHRIEGLARVYALGVSFKPTQTSARRDDGVIRRAGTKEE